MKIGNFGKSSFGGQEEPRLNQQLFRIGYAGISARNLNRRRILCKIGRFFSDSQKKTPKSVHPVGLSEKISLGIKNLNDWAPAGGLVFAIVGAIVFDQCRSTQMAGDLKNLEKRFDKFEKNVDERFDKVDERFNKVDERFNKVDERFNKVDERFNKVDERFNKVDEKIDIIGAKIDKISKIDNIYKTALISMVSSAFAYLLFRLNDAKPPQRE